MLVGSIQVAPPLVEYERKTCSLLRPSRPSTQVSTISFVASAPVGAPLAISTLGSGARSSRAPATPSSTQRLWTGSDRKSTRLNSSHLVISYAVFCLKKKKKKIIYLSIQKKKNT